MKQKTSRGFCGKVQKTVRLKETAERLTGMHRPSGLKFSNGENRARRCPRGAVVACGDPRRGKVIGGYLRAQCTFLRRWVVVEVAGEHHHLPQTRNGTLNTEVHPDHPTSPWIAAGDHRTSRRRRALISLV